MMVHCKERGKLPRAIKSGFTLYFPATVKNHTFYKTEGVNRSLGLCAKNLIDPKTIEKYLEQMVQSGDPLLVFDLYFEDKDICLIPTRPSLLLESFRCDDENNKKSCLSDEQIPEGLVSKSSNSFAYFRWYLMPCLFIIFCWMSMLFPEKMKEHFEEWFFDQGWLDSKNVTKMLPIIPKNMLEAYKMGTIVQKYIFATA